MHMVFLVEPRSAASRFHEKNRLVFCREVRRDEIAAEIARSDAKSVHGD
jgi:hypothetical protein